VRARPARALIVAGDASFRGGLRKPGPTSAAGGVAAPVAGNAIRRAMPEARKPA